MSTPEITNNSTEQTAGPYVRIFGDEELAALDPATRMIAEIVEHQCERATEPKPSNPVEDAHRRVIAAYVANLINARGSGKRRSSGLVPVH